MNEPAESTDANPGQGQPRTDLVFLLGGHDLEMETIRDLLRKYAPRRFFDKGLSWGAKASDYEQEISEALRRGHCPVLIELAADLELDPDKVVIVDHHGRRAGSDKESSLEQVFHLLGLPGERWTRWHELVAVNDRGSIRALREAGAGDEEIVEIRNRDRRAQGVTAEEERAAQAAARNLKQVADERLTVVRLPHNRTSPVTDFLDPAFGGPGYENLLIISPGELNFYGSGDIIEHLDKQMPGGWRGGSLPDYGFWGIDPRSKAELRKMAEKIESIALD